MKRLKLRGRHKNGPFFAIVDDDDFERLNQYRWWRLAVKGSLTHYARTEIDGETVYLHRMVRIAPDDMTVDHINRDGLDCRKENLRVVTQGDNMRAWITPKELSIQTVHRKLRDGSIRTYRYNRRTRERLGT